VLFRLPERRACAPSYLLTERMPRIRPLIGLIGLSPVPVGVQISPYTRQFSVSGQRIADAEDSVVEGAEFELSGDFLNGQ
jgi:hypothetical protein